MQMGPVEEKIDLESDEEVPLSSSQATSKMHTFDFEASHIGSRAKLSNSYFSKKICLRPLRSIYIVLIKAKINILLPFGPLAIMLHYLTGKHVRSTDFSYYFLIHFNYKGILSWFYFCRWCCRDGSSSSAYWALHL